MVLSDFKNLETVKAFQFAFEKWLPEKCLCRFCKQYAYLPTKLTFFEFLIHFVFLLDISNGYYVNRIVGID